MREEGDTPYTSRDSGTRALRVPRDTTPRSESHTQPALTREQRHRLLRRESLRGSSYPKDASLASEADSQTWKLGSRVRGGGGGGDTLRPRQTRVSHPAPRPGERSMDTHNSSTAKAHVLGSWRTNPGTRFHV